VADPLAKFADLRDFPGKREPVNRKLAEPVPEFKPWDNNPRHYKVKGIDTEFFTVGHLAEALHRTPRTIRWWEDKGVLPPATFRAPKPHKSQLKQVGDRLYSREQIEAVIKVAEEEGVLDGKPPKRSFTEKVARAWLAIQRGST
jgi:hypothetical protein